jgi:transporter family protein
MRKRASLASGYCKVERIAGQADDVTAAAMSCKIFDAIFFGIYMNNNWIWFALGSAFFAALTSLLGKLGVAGMNSNLATFIRICVILLITAVIVSVRNEWQRPQNLSTSNWVYLILSAVATGLSWLCYYRALQLGPVSKVAPVDKLSVALSIILGVLILGEKLTWSVVLGGGLIVAGSLVIILF